MTLINLKNWNPVFFILILGLSLSACGTDNKSLPGANNEKAINEADELAMREIITSSIEAWNAKNWTGAATFYTEDATLIPPGESVLEGKADILVFWEGNVESASGPLDLTIKKAQQKGSIGYVWGTFRTNGSAEEQATRGRILYILEQTSSGEWKIQMEMWNLSPAG